MSEETVETPENLAENASSQDETIASLLEQITTLNQERDDLRDQLMRSIADLQNFRKRVMQDREKDRVLATQSLIQDLLPVLDNFERSIMALQSGADMAAVMAGVQSVDKQLKGVLESRQLKRIEAVGQPFDPNLHEALGMVETEDHPEDHIVHELEAGYRIGEQVIRPARVQVAKKP